MKYLAPLGRILYVLIFFMTVSNFKQPAISHAEAAGVPLASIAVPLSGVIAIAGALMHAFWKETDPQTAAMQRAMFLKNVSMLGAALLITQLGSGPLSLK